MSLPQSTFVMPPVQVQITGPRTPHSKQMDILQNDVEQNITVVVRCRPLNDKYGERRSCIELCDARKEVRLGDRYNRVFTYDDVFTPQTSQIDVYRQVVAPLIEQVLDGYNCTVFAYGQTGTGKTYTMEGERSDLDCSWEDDPRSGIIPRAVHQLFETLMTETNEHTVSVTFMELYNEELYDMLSPSEEITKLKIYDDITKKGRVIVGGLAEVTVHTKAEIYDILRKGSAKRQTAATKLNACSSRSHTIFTVTVRVKESSMDGEELIKIGKLNLVDLAGSENIGRSGAVEKRAREAGNINQSLLTLGRVITSLVDKAPHIPYRESKLTRLLRDSLGGGTKTSIIATISPNQFDLEDTISTLEYAARAKKIMNKPEVNQKLSKKTLLREYTNEIEKLRREVEAARGGANAFVVDKANYDEMIETLELQTKDLEEKEAAIKSMQDEVDRISEMFASTTAELDEKKAVLEKTTNKLVNTERVLDKTKETLKVVTKDRNEQKHLVEKHVDTEVKLSKQAHELLNVAHTTTDHVAKLHTKVDRQTDIGNKNYTNIDNYAAQFKSHMQRLKEIIENSSKEQLEELESGIKSKYESFANSLTALVDRVAAASDDWSKQHSVLTAKTEKDNDLVSECTAAVDESKILKRNFGEFGNETQQALKQMTESFISDVKNVVNSVTRQRNASEEMLMKQIDHATESQQALMAAFDAFKRQVNDVCDGQRKSLSCLHYRCTH